MANKAKVNKKIILPGEENEDRTVKYDNKDLLESYTREAVNEVFKKKGGIEVPIQSLNYLIVSRYKVDILELIDYTKTTLEEMPDISNKNLSIILLLKVANNSKNKRMGRIAKQMLKENWWGKNGSEKADDFYKKLVEFFNNQKTKELLKESLYKILEMIVDLHRRPVDDKHQK